MANPDFEIRRHILVGDTADVFLQRAMTILRNENINPVVVVEFSSSQEGIFCGISEVKSLLDKILPETGSEAWALEEGEDVAANEVALRITAPYGSLGLYETAISGILSSNTGWASAARDCVNAADGIPVVTLSASRVHPDVSATVDYASIIGGCVSCSTTQGARLAGVTPSGNMSHGLALLMSDTVTAMKAFDRHMPHEVPRVAIVDTFKDEAEESLNVARALKEKLRGVRLDTPKERGGVTIGLVKEIRSRLDQAAFDHVEIMVSGGFTPDKIGEFVEANAPVNVFGVGSFIANSSPHQYIANICEIDGRAVGKRGRIPGVTANSRLIRIM